LKIEVGGRKGRHKPAIQGRKPKRDVCLHYLALKINWSEVQILQYKLPETDKNYL